MPVDSDSAIAWHRAQLKKLRETLKSIETARFTVGEPAQSSRTGKTTSRRMPRERVPVAPGVSGGAAAIPTPA